MPSRYRLSPIGGLQALPFVIALTTGSSYASGQRLTCYPIRPGDTAARLARELTGNADNRNERWFQIVDPATATRVPKSHYEVIQTGWQVCVASNKARRQLAQPAAPQVSSAAPAVPLTETGPTTANAVGVLWWATPLFVVASSLGFAWAEKYLRRRRATLCAMRVYGERFVAEFERPLFHRTEASPIKWRLRFAPGRRRMEILLAPVDGRIYPNLFDHKKNVEYDVDRVRRILRDEPFFDDPPYGEGPWVVIPFRFET